MNSVFPKTFRETVTVTVTAISKVLIQYKLNNIWIKKLLPVKLCFQFSKNIKRNFFVINFLDINSEIIHTFIYHSHIYTESLRCRLSKIYLNSSSSKLRICKYLEIPTWACVLLKHFLVFQFLVCTNHQPNEWKEVEWMKFIKWTLKYLGGEKIEFSFSKLKCFDTFFKRYIYIYIIAEMRKRG